MRTAFIALVLVTGCGSSTTTTTTTTTGSESSETSRREDPVSQSVIDAVQGASGDVMACYDEALDAGRTEGGQLTVRIVIGADGNVVGVTATQDAVGGGVAECVFGVLSGIHVATPPAEPTPFEFPFRFRPADGT